MGSIYHLRSPSDTLEVFLQPDPVRFTNANGITSTPDGRILYVGFLEGVARLDVGARSLALVPAPDSVSTAAVDGLYWYRGSLIAVQHMPTLEQVVVMHCPRMVIRSSPGARSSVDCRSFTSRRPVRSSDRGSTTSRTVSTRASTTARARSRLRPVRSGPPFASLSSAHSNCRQIGAQPRRVAEVDWR